MSALLSALLSTAELRALSLYSEPESNRHGRNGHGSLSPACLTSFTIGALKNNLYVVQFKRMTVSLLGYISRVTKVLT